MTERQNDRMTGKQRDISWLNKCDEVTMIISQFYIFKSLRQWSFERMPRFTEVVVTIRLQNISTSWIKKMEAEVANTKI